MLRCMTYVKLLNMLYRHYRTYYVCCGRQMVLSFTVLLYTRPTYGDYSYPWWAIIVGWCLALCSIAPIPIVMCYKLLHAQGPPLRVGYVHVHVQRCVYMYV